MAGNPTEINHLQPGDQVSPSNISEVTRALEQRLIELQNQVIALAGGDQLEYVNQVPVSPSVRDYQMVYYNPATRVYEPALSLAVLSPSGAEPVQKSYCLGMVFNVKNGYADLAYNGVMKNVHTPYDDTSIALQMLEPGLEWMDGKRYFLSETHPGRITHKQTALEISVGRSGPEEFFVDLNEQPPQIRAYTERTSVGMRPVGDTRPMEGNSDRHRVVAFDGIEYLGGQVDEWQTTRQSNNEVIQNNGWLKADIRWTKNASAHVEGILIFRKQVGASDVDYWFVETLQQWDGPDSTVYGTLSGLDSGSIQTLELRNRNEEVSAVVYTGLTSDDSTRERYAVLRVPDSFIGWKDISDLLGDGGDQYMFYWEGNDGQVRPVYVDDPYPFQAFEMTTSDRLLPIAEDTSFYEGESNPDPNWEWVDDGVRGQLRPLENATQYFSRLARSSNGLPEVRCSIFDYNETFDDAPAYPIPANPLFNTPKFLPQNPSVPGKVRIFRMVKATSAIGSTLDDGITAGSVLLRGIKPATQDVVYPVKAILSDMYLVLDFEAREHDHIIDLDGYSYQLEGTGVSGAPGVSLTEWYDNKALYWSVFESDEVLGNDLRNSLIRVTSDEGVDITTQVDNGYVREVRVWSVIGSKYVVANVQFSELVHGTSYQIMRPPMYYYNTPADLNFQSRWPLYDHVGTVFTKNGVELSTAALDESNSRFYEPDVVVGYSRHTLYWNASPASNRPWHSEYVHLTDPYQGVSAKVPATQLLQVNGSDAGIIWEWAVDPWTYVHRGSIYTANLSRKLGAGYIRSLSVSPPLELSQLGYDGQFSKTGQTGHVHLKLSNQQNMLGQVNFEANSPAGLRFTLMRNNFNRTVILTQLIVYCDNILGTPTVNPEISVGTRLGSVNNQNRNYDQFAQNVAILAQVEGQAQIIQLPSTSAVSMIRPTEALELTISKTGKVTLDSGNPGVWQLKGLAFGYVLD
jgi:hypothetical protein